MKREFMWLFGCMLVFTSCSTSRKSLDISKMEGEWNIIEVNGTALQHRPGSQQPYIGFDVASKRVYGNSGCNHIMAELSSKSGVIDFGNMASTMMACPDMETEDKVRSALGQVCSFKKAGKDMVTLYDASKNPVVLLQKRFYPMTLAELNGQWIIESVFNQPVPAGLERMPFVNFDIEGNVVMGMAGCNRMKGSLTVSEDKLSVSIPPMATTRMACPNMELEGNVLSALSSIKTFGRLDKDRIALFSTGGAQVMVLKGDKNLKAGQ